MTRDPLFGVAGTGGCGTNISVALMKRCHPGQSKCQYHLVIDTDRAHLADSFEDVSGDPNLEAWKQATNQITVFTLGESGRGAGGDPEEGRRVAQSAAQEIQDFLHPNGKPLDSLLLIAGGGGGTGCGAAPYIAQIAREAEIPTLGILTKPLSNEGYDRLRRAEEAHRQLLEHCPVLVLENEKLTDPSFTIKEGWDRINESCPIPMLMGLREISQRVGRQKNLDPMDWKKFLGSGRHVYFGISCCEKGKPTDMELVLRTLLGEGSFQQPEILRYSERLFLWLHGPWTKGEIDRIVFGVREFAGPAGENSPGIREVMWGNITSVDDEKWVELLGNAQELPDEVWPQIKPANRKLETMVSEGRLPAIVEKGPVTIRFRTLESNVDRECSVEIPEGDARLFLDATNGRCSDLDATRRVVANIKRLSGYSPRLTPATWELLQNGGKANGKAS